MEADEARAEGERRHGEAAGEAIFSPEGGTIAHLPNGNTLITASESGRAVELSAEDDVVWEYLSPHRAGPGDQLVATIWEVQRLAPEAAEAFGSEAVAGETGRREERDEEP